MNPERILIAAEAVGLGPASRSTRAVAYAKERVVFNRPIGQNQAIQHPLAQKLDGARGGEPDGRCRRPGSTTAASPAAPRPTPPSTSPARPASTPARPAVMTHGGYRLRQGVPRRALPARGDDPAHRADQPAAHPVLHRREGARPAEVVLRHRMTEQPKLLALDTGIHWDDLVLGTRFHTRKRTVTETDLDNLSTWLADRGTLRQRRSGRPRKDVRPRPARCRRARLQLCRRDGRTVVPGLRSLPSSTRPST